jgi:hypothetical protein
MKQKVHGLSNENKKILKKKRKEEVVGSSTWRVVNADQASVVEFFCKIRTVWKRYML